MPENFRSQNPSGSTRIGPLGHGFRALDWTHRIKSGKMANPFPVLVGRHNAQWRSKPAVARKIKEKNMLRSLYATALMPFCLISAPCFAQQPTIQSLLVTSTANY